MKIGPYDIIPIETGRFALDGGAMFGVVPKNLWNRTNPADEYNRIELALRSLLLKSSDHCILIDAGINKNFDEKLSSIYKIDFSKYSLEKSLAKYDINPRDITDIIITHLHFDHAGGCSFKENNVLKLTFPNANHYIQEKQWYWALNPSEKDRASFFEDHFKLIEKEGKLKLLKGPDQIIPAIEIFVLNGHTPAMQIVKIADEKNILLFCSDLIPTASHISIPWVMAYDNEPLTTIMEKKALLPRIVEEKWILLFEHDPFRAAGTVRLTEKGYKLEQEFLID